MKQVTNVNVAQLRECLDYCCFTGNFFWKKLPRQRNDLLGKQAGSETSHGYIQIKIFGRFIYAHRLAYLWMTGMWPENQMDHRNGDKWDNRWRNIRPATRSQNMANMRRKNRSFLKGVRITPKGKYQAQLKGYIGTFSTEQEAHLAYCQRAKEVYGDYHCAY